MNEIFDTRAAYVLMGAEKRHTLKRRCTLGKMTLPKKLIGGQDAHLINVDIEVSFLHS
jgi:hypothetical protein